MAVRHLIAALILCGASSAGASAQALADPELVPAEDLAPLVRLLLAEIEALSDYQSTGPVPAVFLLPQHRIEQKVCDTPCNVRAAYLPREGIYLSAHLDPVHDPLDRAALVHELVHHLQQGHPKFEAMDGCQRERAKEQEAYALQNAYLAAIGRHERVVFYDDFDCGGIQSASPQ